MPTNKNTSYNPREVAYIARIHMGIAYAKIAVDAIKSDTDPELRKATLRNVLDTVLPEYYREVPLKVRKHFNVGAKDLEDKCKGLLS